MKKGFCIVFVTCSSRIEAEKIARSLVEEWLCACVNILPGVKSVFTWKGKLSKATETMLMCKTRKNLFKKVEKAVQKMHSYEVPEIISIPVEKGSAKYLGWISETTTKEGRGK